jgi:hypothetical protein
MNDFPENKNGWRTLTFLPFKTYLIAGPICFLVWNIATEGHRTRDARAEAAGSVFLGFSVWFGIFMLTGLTQMILRRRDLAVTSFLYALAACVAAVLWLGVVSA